MSCTSRFCSTFRGIVARLLEFVLQKSSITRVETIPARVFRQIVQNALRINDGLRLLKAIIEILIGNVRSEPALNGNMRGCAEWFWAGYRRANGRESIAALSRQIGRR